MVQTIAGTQYLLRWLLRSIAVMILGGVIVMTVPRTRVVIGIVFPFVILILLFKEVTKMVQEAQRRVER